MFIHRWGIPYLRVGLLLAVTGVGDGHAGDAYGSGSSWAYFVVDDGDYGMVHHNQEQPKYGCGCGYEDGDGYTQGGK